MTVVPRPLHRNVIVFLALSVFLMTPLLFWGGPEYYSTRLTRMAWDLGHPGLFALIAIVAVSWLRSRGGLTPAATIILLLFAVLAGAMIELIQSLLPQRSVSAHDVLGDVVGAGIGLIWMRAPWPRPFWQPLVRLAVVLMAMAYLSRPAAVVFDEVLMRHQFPALATFEWSTETSRFAHPQFMERQESDGMSVALISLRPATYAGFSLDQFIGDWRGYSRLQISLWLPAARKVTVRIHDEQHQHGDQEFADRHNQRFELKAGWNVMDVHLAAIVTLASGRTMDLAQVAGVGVFTIDLTQPEQWRLGSIRLLK